MRICAEKKQPWKLDSLASTKVQEFRGERFGHRCSPSKITALLQTKWHAALTTFSALRILSACDPASRCVVVLARRRVGRRWTSRTHPAQSGGFCFFWPAEWVGPRGHQRFH